MAYNVFGNPITNSTLEGMPEYVGKEITRTDRARVALNMKNSAEKDVNARKYVEQLKQRWGVGVSTLCLVYNATGDTLRYVKSTDWYGHIGPAPYPQEIANGQWGAFLHVKTSGVACGSEAAVVYRGKDGSGYSRDWILGWSNPWNRNLFDNQAYTTIISSGGHVQWRTFFSQLESSQLAHTCYWNGCKSIVSTGSYTSPVYEGIMTLDI